MGQRWANSKGLFVLFHGLFHLSTEICKGDVNSGQKVDEMGGKWANSEGLFALFLFYFWFISPLDGDLQGVGQRWANSKGLFVLFHGLFHLSTEICKGDVNSGQKVDEVGGKWANLKGLFVLFHVLCDRVAVVGGDSMGSMGSMDGSEGLWMSVSMMDGWEGVRGPSHRSHHRVAPARHASERGLSDGSTVQYSTVHVRVQVCTGILVHADGRQRVEDPSS